MSRALGRVVCFIVVLAACPVHNLFADGPRRYDGYKVVRVCVETDAQLARLEEISATFWSEHVGLGEVDVVLAPERLPALEQMGLPYTVRIEDVQVLIDNERAAAPQVWFDDYHNYLDIVAYLNQLVSDHPGLAQMVTVGTTHESRVIWGIRIAGANVDAGSPTVIYFSTVHAREWITATVPPYVATYLLDNYGTDARVTELVDNVEWILIPVGNPDGYEYTWTTNRLWRKNRRDNGGGVYGVDINRNWGTGWGGAGSSGDPGSETYRGPSPFSEPETQALRDLFINSTNVRAQFDIHSYSQMILWPFGYTATLPADQATYLQIGQEMHDLIYNVHGKTYTYGPVYTTIYPASGVSLDWTYTERGVLSYSFELRDTGYYGFILPADQIIPNNEEVLPAILHLTDSDWVRLPIRFEYPNGLPGPITPGSDTTIAVDLIPQYEQVVPGTARMYYRYDPSGPFVQNPLTWLGGDSHEAVLPATNCTSTPEFYFSVEGDGGTTVTHPRNAPADVYTAWMAASSVLFFDESLSTDPGWSTDGQWAWGQPTGGGGQYGGPDPTTGHTGNYVYGYNLNGDYANDLGEMHLTSPAIDCTGRRGVQLAFWRWLGVEQPAYDHASIRVSNDGTTWSTVWENMSEITDSAWTYQALDISAVADDEPTVYLRWTMGPTDVAWQYCGWNIDDISVSAATCAGVAGDYDGDGDIDLADFAAFPACVTGPAGGINPGCSIFDFADDGDVDLDDFAEFQNAYTGSYANRVVAGDV